MNVKRRSYPLLRKYGFAMVVLSTVCVILGPYILASSAFVPVQNTAKDLASKSVRVVQNKSIVLLDSESSLMCLNKSSLLKMDRDEAEQIFYRQKSTKMNIINDQYLITGRHVCEPNAPFLLIVVPSVPSHTNTRDVIRNTYGAFARSDTDDKMAQLVDGKKVKLAFIVGTDGNRITDLALKRESTLHNDIVQADFDDTYHNLTRKMLLALKWSSIYCGDIEFFLKADEDVFVNVPALVKRLQALPSNIRGAHGGAVYGHVHTNSPVRRSGRWNVGCDQYPFPRYPTYISGNSYGISGSLVPKLFLMSQFYRYLPIEDAFITGILARDLEVKHVDIWGFTFWDETEPLNPCEFYKQNRITANNVNGLLKRQLMKTVLDYNKMCFYFRFWNKV